MAVNGTIGAEVSHRVGALWNACKESSLLGKDKMGMIKETLLLIVLNGSKAWAVDGKV